MANPHRYRSFAEFYPLYLSEHCNVVGRGLHYLGTSLAFAVVIYALAFARYWLILAGLVLGYACAWAVHFFFERNKPATFQYPLWSFVGDWALLKQFLTGQLRDIHPAIGTRE